MTRAAFIGLGVMGYPMAGFLQKNGVQTTVYNRNSARASQWATEYGGVVADTPAAAAEEADLVFTCVGNDDDVRTVVTGSKGVFEGMKSGAILIDHTTASAKLARQLYAEGKQRNLEFLDAPVSGGQAGAENGMLTVMVGGDSAVFDRARPVIESYARAVSLLGGAGSGQLCKMVNQICIAGIVQGLAEGIHFAKTVDLDVEEVVGVISQGAAQSWQMENRYQTMLAQEYDHGFAVQWMRKDLAMVLEQAREAGAHLPQTAMVDQLYSEVQAMGGNRWDTSSLLARLEHFNQS